MVKLLDCTIRDGGHCTNWDFSDEYVYNLMSILNQNKIDFFEIGYRNFRDREEKGDFFYCTPDLIKKFYGKKNKLNLGVMVDTKRYDESDFKNGDEDCIDFVRVATHPNMIKETLLIAETLYKKNYKVMVQLMDITNLSGEHYKILEDWGQKNILETIYIADTYGIAENKDIEIYYNKLKQAGYKNISFHAHNKKHLALANSLKAAELGAYSIDVVQNINGINGGNLLYDDIAEIITDNCSDL